MNRSKDIRNTAFIGLLAGIIYTLLADDLSDPAPPINAVLIGGIGGFFAGIIEFYLFQPQVNRPEFAKSVFLKVVTYFFILSFLVLIIKGSVDSYFAGISILDYLTSEGFINFVLYGEFKIILLYSFSVIFLIIFTMQVNKYLGRGVLWNLITGKYHTPRYENRIILLIDINNSTGIAEKMDPVSYYMLLDRFFFDVNAGARRYGGIIYRYIGDQVTLIWPSGSADENANCIRAFFAICHQVHVQRETYLNQFGFVPGFKGTAHSGQLVTGEIGDIKSQLVYYGSPLLEVAKLERAPGRLPDGLCVSDALLNTLQLPSYYKSQKIADVPFAAGKYLKAMEILEDLPSDL